MPMFSAVYFAAAAAEKREEIGTRNTHGLPLRVIL